MPSKTPSRNRQEQQRIQPHNQQQEQQENVPPCCAQIRHENELLRRALRKERERRMFTTNAYRQLLEQFNHLVDFRRVVASGGGDRRSLANGGDLQSMANEDDHRSVLNGDEHRSFAKGGDDHRSVAKGDDDHRSVLSVNNDHRSFGKGDDDHRSFGKGDDHRSVLSGDEHRSFVKGVDDHRSVETAVHRSVAQGNDRKTLTDNWYFVALDRVDSRNSKGNCSREFSNDDSSELLRDQRVWQMFTRSQQRCKAIRDASRVRAQIAAGRRAVVADLVTGRRALDSEAIDVLLHTDASRVVQAFPPSFMREQRRASRRSYERSPHRMQQERERQRHFEGAINRILAHSSATVAKMIATSENGGISRRPR